MEALIREAVAFAGELVRNIKGVRVSQDLFDDLAMDAADRDVAVAAESATRLPSPAPLITRPFDYGAVITYPFVPHNWQATRYSDGLAYGVWYGALDLETTVYETVYHWHRFVTDSYAGLDRTVIGERRVFHVRCDAVLIDLRSVREPRLTNRRDYSFTWQVGRYLWERSQTGLLAPSARSDGISAAIFRPEALSAVRDLCFLTYRLNPAFDRVVVERAPGMQWLELKPSALG